MSLASDGFHDWAHLSPALKSHESDACFTCKGVFNVYSSNLGHGPILMLPMYVDISSA
jgi:hypothetical protein